VGAGVVAIRAGDKGGRCGRPIVGGFSAAGIASMSIIIVRHGGTPLNIARVLQPADTPLSERGAAQARAVARRLAAQSPKAIVSSDLPRALATAQAIAAATGLPLRTTPLLHERNFGELRGRAYDTLSFDPLTMEEAPPGGESAAAFRDRVARAFEHIVAERAAAGGDLVVVTHGLVIRALLAHHVALAEDPADLHIGNTCVTVIDAEPPHAASLVDCSRHLDIDGEDAHALSGG